VHGRVEDIQIPEQVDIIVSEWMGYFVYHGRMLDPVMIGRERFLKKDGLMFPSEVTVTPLLPLLLLLA
jgi:hypothetical protein